MAMVVDDRGADLANLNGGPRVAVIVPSYNRMATLDRCLGSLEAQTFSAIEVIVVDDGSTDGTGDFLAVRRAATVLDLRCLRQDNAGCASARNAGLRASGAEFFLFLDSDDALECDAIASLLATLDRSGADFVYSPAIEVYANGRRCLNLPVAAGDPDSFAIAHFLDPNVRNGAVMFRRRLLDAVGFVDESMRYNEDSDFVQRYAIHGTAAYCAVPTVQHYHHAGNKSGNRVRIYEALLDSSTRLLAGHPAFRERLGERGAVRINEIRRLLLESLIVAGDFPAAARIAAIVEGLSLVCRLAISAKVRWPLLAAQAMRHVMAAVRGRLGWNRQAA
jgi:glycosyltransferase involved in cell wall biosynthesis